MLFKSKIIQQILDFLNENLADQLYSAFFMTGHKPIQLKFKFNFEYSKRNYGSISILSLIALWNDITKVLLADVIVVLRVILYQKWTQRRKTFETWQHCIDI